MQQQPISATDCRFCGAAANVSCRACGLFCGTCDAVYHTVPSRAAHVREAVAIMNEAPTQEESESDESAAQKAMPTIYCDDDMVEFATVFWCVLCPECQ